MNLQITKTVLMHAAGSIYETITGRNFTQRLIRRKLAKIFAPVQPSAEECQRLNDQASRSI